jgi:hypothetical protein
MTEKTERRRRRSEDPITALHYQLSAVRNETGLDALVLVDDSGCLVAGAGAWPICEELAAYAPFIARKSERQSREVNDRAGQIAQDTLVKSLSVSGAEVLLCARDKRTNEALPHVVRAANGCMRLLGAA